MVTVKFPYWVYSYIRISLRLTIAWELTETLEMWMPSFDSWHI